MKRIGIAGAPGSGKTTLARALSAFLSSEMPPKRVELVSEYARRYVAKLGPILDVMDQYRITQKQIDWEGSIPESQTDVMITDSPIHLGFFYALRLRKIDSHKETVFINDLFKLLNNLNTPPRYDIIFYLPPVIKALSDGVRMEDHLSDDWRKEADQEMRGIFRLFPPKKLIEISETDLMQRVHTCQMHLAI